MNWMDDFQHGGKLSTLGSVSLLVLMSAALILANCLARKFPGPWRLGSDLNPARTLIDLTIKHPQPLRINVIWREGPSSSADHFLRRLNLYLHNLQTLMSRHNLVLELGIADGRDCLTTADPTDTSGLLLIQGSRKYFVPFNESPLPNVILPASGSLSATTALDSFLSHALERLFQIDRPLVHFIQGHGECSMDNDFSDGGLSRLKLALEADGIRADTIAIGDLRTIDPARSLLIIADPRTDFEDWESAELLDFLGQRAGKLLLILTPKSTASLDEFLENWGIRVGRELSGMADNLPCGSPIFPFESTLPMLRNLQQSRLPIRCEETITFTGHPSIDDRPPLSPLLTIQGPSAHGPEAVAMLSGRNIAGNLPIHLDEGKLVVLGGNFLANRHFYTPGNRRLFRVLLGWFFDETHGTNPLDGPDVPVQFCLDRRERRRLLEILLAIPAGLGLLALSIHLSRRNR